MKRTFLTSLLILTGIFSASALNVKTCRCPASTAAGTEEGDWADTVFVFSDKSKVILCGKRVKSNPRVVYYSNFILKACTEDTTFLDFWHDSELTRVSMRNDTITITGLKDFFYGTVLNPGDWRTDKIFFADGKLTRTYGLNRSIRKYTAEEISKTLEHYKMAEKGITDFKVLLANRLFMASMSGSETAKTYFKELETEFGDLETGANDIEKHLKKEFRKVKEMMELWFQQ